MITIKNLLTKKQLNLQNYNIINVRKKWNSNYETFILGIKNDYYLLNTDLIVSNIKKSLLFIRQIIKNNNKLLILSQEYLIINKILILKNINILLETSWIKGLFTNWINNKKNRVKKNNLLYIKGSIKNKITNKKKNILKKVPDCLFVHPAMQYKIALVEANKLNIPIISFVSITNYFTQLKHITYPIPLNETSSNIIDIYNILFLNNIKLGLLLKYKKIYQLYNLLNK